MPVPLHLQPSGGTIRSVARRILVSDALCGRILFKVVVAAMRVGKLRILVPFATAHQAVCQCRRGFGTVVKPEFRDSDKIKVCATCHKCAEACPTGALKILDK